MSEIDEQRRKVENLKQMILEQKRKASGGDGEVAEPPPAKALEELADERLIDKAEAARKIEEARRHEQQKAEEEARRKEEAQKKAEAEQQAAAKAFSPELALKAYGEVLKFAWEDGMVSREEEAILKVLRETLNISENQHRDIAQEMQLGIYLQALVDGWKGGAITPEDSERLDMLREKFNISADEHMRLEKQVRKEILRQKS